MIRPRVLMTILACMAIGACGGDNNPNKPGAACDYTADAAKDYSDFLSDYPSNLAAAGVALANMQSSLTAAGHAATNQGDLFNAIQAAQRAVDNAQTALDQNKPVNTGSLTGAMADIGNLCSQGAGD